MKSTREFGGTLLGLILGLTLGLALALGVAFYLSKTPPQEKPGIRAPNLPLTIKPAVPVEEEGAPAATPLDLNKPLQGKNHLAMRKLAPIRFAILPMAKNLSKSQQMSKPQKPRIPNPFSLSK